jgi:membrane protein
MPSLKDRASEVLQRARARSGFLDHAIRTQQHYTAVKGNLQAAAVTYFAFLSFFPILALAFFVVGYIARVFPDAQESLVDAIESVLPGLIGSGDDQISLETVQKAAATLGLIGLVALLYAGLGWLSAMRKGLATMFQEPREHEPGFVLGKLRDLLTLPLVGLILIVSVAISGAVTGYSKELLDLVGVDRDLTVLLAVLAVVIGGAADMVLLYALFRVLVRPALPARALWSGALVGAIGAEALKFLSSFLIGLTRDQPAVQAFGIALILLIWINYFSRVVMYAAAWAYTATDPSSSMTERSVETV